MSPLRPAVVNMMLRDHARQQSADVRPDGDRDGEGFGERALETTTLSLPRSADEQCGANGRDI